MQTKNRLLDFIFQISIILALSFLCSLLLAGCEDDTSSDSDESIFGDWLEESDFKSEIENGIEAGIYPIQISARELESVEYRALYDSLANNVSFYVFLNLTQLEFDNWSTIFSNMGYFLTSSSLIEFSNNQYVAIWAIDHTFTERLVNTGPPCESAVLGSEAYSFLIGSTTCGWMEGTDAAKCRDSDSGSCRSHSNLSDVCEAGSTVGNRPYLPSVSELLQIYQSIGTGSPETDRGICIQNSGDCARRRWVRSLLL